MERTNVWGLASFGLGLAFGLLLVVAHQHVVTPAHADDAAKGNNIMAIGSGVKDKRNNGCLWIYNPDKKSLVCYVNVGGQQIRMVGVRRVTYDLELVKYNDKSELEVEEMKKKIEEINKKAAAGK